MTTSISREQFLQALRDHPEWREEVRVQILGEELMRLPVAFQAFVVSQERFNANQERFNANQEKFNANQEKFNAEMREFRAETLRRFDNIDRRFDRMEGDSSWLKNAATEATAASGAFAICLAAECEMNRVLDRNEVVAMAKALPGENVTPGHRASFSRADLIIEGTSATGDTMYLAVEVSYTAAQRDQDRARRNAGYLTEITGRPAIPVVAGVRYDHALQEAIDQGELVWFEVDEP